MKRFFLKMFLFWGATGAFFSIQAQEFLTGIGVNTQIIKEAQKQKLLFDREKKETKPIFLPFFEDFSNYTGYPNEKLFVDKQAFVNQTFAVFPPTIGVVTLDALDENGKIYSHLNETPKGADTLTSRFIRLDSLMVSGTLKAINFDKDSLYFSFYFQPGGASEKSGDASGRIGSQPNKNDSLVLEFRYAYMKEGTLKTGWKHVWSTPGFSADTWISVDSTKYQYFKQVLISITDTIYRHAQFQFRFRNYVSLESQQGIMGWQGNVDQWHIDYIRLDTGRNYKDFYTNDLAFVKPTTSFLEKYQAMPYKQFKPTEIKQNFTNYLTNLSENFRTSKYRYSITHKGVEIDAKESGTIDVCHYDSCGIYKNGDYPTLHISKNKFNDLKDTATFRITHIFQNASGTDKDFCLSNDTCVYEQKFMDYYAYDDGTAEYGYCLNNQYNVAELAMRFSLNVSDSLSAVRMWFNHTKNSENKEAVFSIVVWKDDEEQPGEVLFKSDYYNPDTLHFHDFAEYIFDEKIYIEKDKIFWIGFKQQGNVQLNIGFDQNNDSRGVFKYNTSGEWRTSSFSGTPMLRPVFGEPIHFANVPTQNISDINVYPNPTTGELRIENGELRIKGVEIYDVYGRNAGGKFPSNSLEGWQPKADGVVIDISNLQAGIYFLKIITENGIVTKKVIKN